MYLGTLCYLNYNTKIANFTALIIKEFIKHSCQAVNIIITVTLCTERELKKAYEAFHVNPPSAKFLARV